ncbi:MAG: hypothetical protein OEV06_09985 [Anaerolineae bacterium]|nr:hypothetical protein [Anaerolineae bacterium]
MKKTFWLLLVITLVACVGTPPEPTATPELPFLTLTPLAATENPINDLRAEIDALNASLHALETQLAEQGTALADAQGEVSALHAQATQTTIALTPTITPTFQYTPTPSNLMWVVAQRDKVNLRRIHSYNDAGRPIMVIQEPRIQYLEGETFLVYIPIILADGGDRYYEVYGPRGAGLYVRSTDISKIE